MCSNVQEVWQRFFERDHKTEVTVGALDLRFQHSKLVHVTTTICPAEDDKDLLLIAEN